MGDKYIRQFVKVDNIASMRNNWLSPEQYIELASKYPMSFAKACELYGHFMTIPIENCDMFALSNSGILYNTKNHNLITPEVKFGKYCFDDRASLPLPHKGRMMDIGELVIKSRFRIDPMSIKITYTLDSDDTVVAMSSLEFLFKEPEVIPIPPEYGIIVRKFYDEYFIRRNSNTAFMVSQSGAVYNEGKKEFLPIYLQKIFSKADNAKVLRPVVYPFGYPVYLLDYVIEEWSGFDVPQQYSAINTSGISSKVSLKEFVIRDMRARSIKDPSQYNQRLYEKRASTLNHFRKDVENGIRETMDLIRKYDQK